MVSTMDTAIGIIAYVGALGLTAVASLMLALFVVTRARALPGSALLALFLVGVASWSIAQAIPAIVGPAATPFTATLIALNGVAARCGPSRSRATRSPGSPRS